MSSPIDSLAIRCRARSLTAHDLKTGSAVPRTILSIPVLILIAAFIPIRIAPQSVAKGVIHVRVFQPNGERIRIPVELVKPSKYNGLPLMLKLSAQMPEESTSEEYQFTVAPGEYYVRAGNSGGTYVRTYYPNAANPQDAKAIKVSSGEHVTADIHLSTAPTFRISGRMIDSLPDREPHYYAGVWLRSASLVVQELKTVSANPGVPVCCAVVQVPDLDVSVTTQGDRFEIAGVRAGKYELIASMMVGEIKPGQFVIVKAGERFPYSRTYRALMELNVGDSNIDDIKVVINHGIDLTGSIVTSGKGINTKNIYIELSGRNFDSLLQTYTDRNGQFVFPNLLQGKYNLSVGLPPGKAYIESIVQGTKVITGSKGLSLRSNVLFEFEKETPAPLRIIVNGNGATIRGNVSEMKEAAIVLASAESSTESTVIRWGMSDSTGAFAFPDGVPPGNYRIYAIPRGSIDLIWGTAIKIPERFLIHGTELTVKPGERVVVKLNRIPE